MYKLYFKNIVQSFSCLTCKGQSIIKINNNNYLKDQKEIKELWVIYNIHDLE